MKKLSLFVILTAALPAGLPAAAVSWATYLVAEGSQSQFTHPFDERGSITTEWNLYAAADLSSGALRMYNYHTGTGGQATQALFYDTITFASTAFEGAYGATYNLTLTGTFTGNYDLISGAVHDSGLGGRIQVYSGDTVIDSSVFTDSNSLTDFLFLDANRPTPLCATGVGGPDLTSSAGPFSFNVTCSVVVDALHPSFRIFMNAAAAFNSDVPTQWRLDMTHTATLDLGDLGGRTVYSGSGVLPGTVAAVPEPGTMLLFALGAGTIGLARVRAFWRRARG